MRKQGHLGHFLPIRMIYMKKRVTFLGSLKGHWGHRQVTFTINGQKKSTPKGARWFI